MHKLRYLTQAKNDLIAIKRYIETRSGNKQMALEFTARLRAQCRKLADSPGQLGRHRPELKEGLRSFPYGNYVIFFQYDDTTLTIVSIIEHHRDVDALL